MDPISEIICRLSAFDEELLLLINGLHPPSSTASCGLSATNGFGFRSTFCWLALLCVVTRGIMDFYAC